MQNTLKKMLILALSLCLMCSLFLPVTASSSDVNVMVDGEEIDFTGDQPPEIDANGRTLVPIRRVFEKLGSDVVIEWFETERQVCISKGVIAVTLEIDNPYLAVYNNGETSVVTMDTVPIIKNGRTMLPARYVAEQLGATVSWVEVSRTVIIQSAGKKAKMPNVVGKTKAEAEAILKAHGLSVIVEYEPSESVGEGLVIKQSPLADADISENASVTITVSTGTAAVLPLPPPPSPPLPPLPPVPLLDLPGDGI